MLVHLGGISKSFNLLCLTHSMPLVFFYTPWTRQKTRDVPIFSGGVENVQWHEMGWSIDLPIITFTYAEIFS